MLHSTFTDLFRTAAEKHVLIRHSATNKAFYRIIASGPPYDGLYIEELRQAMRNLKMQYGYCMMLETYTNDYQDSMSFNIQKEYNAAFYILGRIGTKNDFDKQEEILDKSEQIAEDILAYWKAALETIVRDRVHKFNGTGLEKVMADEKYFGTKCYFQFTKSANLQLMYDATDTDKWLP